jgi:membrane-associated phospholipid phosphatase
VRARPTSAFLRLLAAWVALALLGWAAGAAITPVTRSADVSLVRDVVSDRTHTLTALAHTLSFIGSGWVLTPVTVVLAVVLWIRRHRADALAIGLSLWAGIGLSSLVKVLVDRPRPPVRHLEQVSSASFPSGHATQSTAFLLAVLLAWLVHHDARNLRAPITATVVLIAAIAASRVYLGVHYPSDVIAGILLGAAWALITRRLLFGATAPPGWWPRTRPRRSAGAARRCPSA